MEPGTQKTLRVLGIIATTFLTLGACGILLLLGVCAAVSFGGPQAPSKGIPFYIGALFVLGLGIWIIVTLARGLMRAHREEIAAYRESQAGPSSGALPAIPVPDLPPLQISPEGQKASDLVVFAIFGSFLFTFISWFLNQRAVSLHRNNMPLGLWLYLAVIFGLYNLPYAVLVVSFLTKPGRHTFYYAVTVPGTQTLFALFTMVPLAALYARNQRALLLVLIGWLIDIAILVLAWRAMQKNRVRVEPAGLIVATLAPFFYFLIVRFIAPLFYRFTWR